VIATSPKSTRLETRCPGADMNPYLAAAACIAAGLHGVEKNLKLTAKPIHGTNVGAENVPRAPRTLIETTRNFKGSKLARDCSVMISSTTSRRHASGNGGNGSTA